MMVTLKSRNRVEFRFFRPNARQVFLVGDFNGWSNTTTPMKPTGTGEWVHVTPLTRGVHQFKYLADGEWYLDYAAFGLEKGPYGWNSVVVVEPTPLPRHHSTPSAA
ncbi:MAG TPA: glycoside hydrolase family 13 [Phycisphaerae bacterium]|nr:glycoside hydrolase family 13 [Phycisphaerae bacterium]